MAVGGVKGDVLGISEPQHLLFCPLQLLEMSFNCLEDVESTIPVSPLHLAVSPRSFPLAFPVPRPPQAGSQVPAHVNPSLLLPSRGDVASRQWSERGPRSSRGGLLPRVSPWAPRAEWGHVWSFIHGFPTPLQAYNGHCEALKTLAETLVNLDVRDHKGRTALFLATERGSTECVEVLTAHGASALIKERKRKWTPLHAAGKAALGLLPPLPPLGLVPSSLQNPEGTGVATGQGREDGNLKSWLSPKTPPHPVSSHDPHPPPGLPRPCLTLRAPSSPSCLWPH